jgi:hypothetical protein
MALPLDFYVIRTLNPNMTIAQTLMALDTFRVLVLSSLVFLTWQTPLKSPLDFSETLEDLFLELLFCGLKKILEPF